MTRMWKRAAVVGILTLLAIAALGTVALADDGGVMQQLMGHEAFTAMVEQMRGVLGAERADQMLAACEEHMAEAGAAGMGGMMNGMSGMMGGMAQMMGGR